MSSNAKTRATAKAKPKAKTPTKRDVEFVERVIASRLQNVAPEAIAERLGCSVVEVRQILDTAYTQYAADDHEYEQSLARMALIERTLTRRAIQDPTADDVDMLLKIDRQRRTMRREAKTEQAEMDKWREARAEKARMDLEIQQGKWLPKDKVETQMRHLANNIKKAQQEITERYGEGAGKMLRGIIMDRPNE